MGQTLKVMIVDDDPDSRLLLARFLRGFGHGIVTAENGREAVERFEAESPDIIFMDVMMPEMNGYEAARAIKQAAGEHFVPIIFLTALEDDKALAKCVEYGGDDFLTKPYRKTILKAKVDALLRLRDLYATLQSQRDELARHEVRMRREHELAERVFANIARRAHASAPDIRQLSQPAAISNGDLVLVAERPSGERHILLGDFTGHGLSAAIGALPVSDLFFQLTAAGADLRALITTINAKLREVLPTGMFFAACLLEQSRDARELTVWSGGIPDLLLQHPGGDIDRIPAEQLPLGVVDNRELDMQLRRIPIGDGDRLYLYSDGLIEAENAAGEMFGEERLLACLDDVQGSAFDRIRESVAAFRGDHPQRDDITLLELTCRA